MKVCYCFIFLFVNVYGIFDEFEGTNNSTLAEERLLTFGNGEHSILEPPMEEELDEEAIDTYCVDISSDCEEREHFCENQAFHDVMIERCPRTCNLCKELITRRTIVTPATSDEDYYVPPPEPLITPKPLPIIIPSTFPPFQPPSSLPSPTSEEEEAMQPISLVQLVGSAERHISDIEAIDKATTTTTKRTKKLKARKVCRDHASDCNSKLRLCQNQYYSSIMERFCEKTCGFCNDKQTFKKHKTINNRAKNSKKNKFRGRPTSSTSTGTSTNTCMDLGIDCIEKRSLCTHKSYQTLMKRMCPKTCNMCDTDEV